MVRKFKYTLLPFLLLLVLGACADNKETETPAESSAGTETETPAESSAETETATEVPQVDEEEVVAVVNGEEVTGKVYNSVASQMEATLQAQGQDAGDAEQLKTQALDVIIGNSLIIQDAKSKGHEPEEAAVEEQLELMTSQFETEEALNEALKHTGFSIEDLREQIREQLLYEKYVAEEVETAEVTDAEVQEAYDSFAAAQEDAPSLEEVSPEIRTSLEQQRISEALVKRIEELKAAADIEIRI